MSQKSRSAEELSGKGRNGTETASGTGTGTGQDWNRDCGYQTSGKVGSARLHGPE